MGKYRPLRARGVKNIRRAGDGADARARRRRSRSSVVSGRVELARRVSHAAVGRDSTSGSTSENVRAPLVCGRRRDDDPHAIDALVSRTRTRRSL